jgi:hypothetical protein
MGREDRTGGAGPKRAPASCARWPNRRQGSSGEFLAQARAKIAELEPKIGQQAPDTDFFHKALRALDAADRLLTGIAKTE